MTITAERSGAQRTASSLDDINRCPFRRQADSKGIGHCVSLRLAVNPCGRLAQQAGRAGERCVNSTEVGELVRVGAARSILFDEFPDRRRRPEPASSDSAAAVPEARSLQVGARRADAGGFSVIEMDVHARARRHAYSHPAITRDAYARLTEIDCDENWLVALVPGCDEGMGNEGRSGAPSLRTVQRDAACVRNNFRSEACRRRFCRPNSPRLTAFRDATNAQFGHDRERVRMAFEQLDQCEIARRDRREHSPALKRRAMTGEWQPIKSGVDQGMERAGGISVRAALEAEFTQKRAENGLARGLGSHCLHGDRSQPLAWMKSGMSFSVAWCQ